jgi:hypothetical protein
MDVFTVSVFLGTLAILFIGYAFWRYVATTAARLQAESDAAATRPRLDGGRFIGGHDRVGE